MNYENYKNWKRNSYYADPDDITEAIAKLNYMDRDNKHCQQYKDDIADAVYDLMANADNEYNSDYHRLIYVALAEITEKVHEGKIQY